MSKSSEQFSGNRIRSAVIGVSLLASAGFLINSCGSDDDGVAKLELPKSDIEAYCDNDPFLLSEYKAEVGDGPFAPNEAAQAENPKDSEIIDEAIKDLGQGNAVGVAIYSAQLDQISAAFNPGTEREKATKTFIRIQVDPVAFRKECVRVGTALSNKDLGKVATFKYPEILVSDNVYDTDGNFAGVADPEIAQQQSEFPVLGIQRPDGSVFSGDSLDSIYNGSLVQARTFGDEGGTPEITDNQEKVNVIINPETGVEVPVTFVQTPEGEIIPVTINPETGEQVPVNPATGEPTGEPLPAGSTPVPSPNGGGTGTGSESGTNGGTGEPEGSGPSHSAPGTSQPGTVDTEPGVTSGPTTSTGPGTTTGPTTTTGGTTPTTTTKPTSTTTVKPTTTTTVKPTTTTTVKPTTTTTVKPTTTTTTVKPTTTTTTPTTTTPPTTTQPKGSVPPPPTSVPGWIN